MSPVVGMENNFITRLIVAASHTALSGDLAVLILELPPQDRLEKTTSTPTTTIATSISSLSTITDDIDFIMEEDDEDDDSHVNFDSDQPDPLVLRCFHNIHRKEQHSKVWNLKFK